MDEMAVFPTTIVQAEAATTDAIIHESGSIFNRITADMVEILIYMICLTVGGPLNLFSFYRLIRGYRKHVSSQTQINLLRLHLNLADLLTLFIFVLSQIIWMTTYQWYGGDLLCRICKFFHTFSFYLTSFVVACIAIDRVFGTYNLRSLGTSFLVSLKSLFSSLKASQLAHRRCRRMLCVAWICAFVFSIPQPFIFRVFHPPEMRNFKQCTPIWTVVAYEVELALKNGNMTLEQEKDLVAEYYQMVRLERIYGILHLLFMFWIPAFIIVLSYGAIICILNSLASPSTTQSESVTCCEVGDHNRRQNASLFS
ncbi:hypothetical protein L596_027456 [Steinernema carpocapsae]|uniref:G-protein coupled receptors family 1 profile domain-containing protein n=1 Tax=Steinernema carpocapsae TaxID=34508 RepID=A0A4U5LVJ5_STECR|nr:hypothetical protein L596_027456 [Steinernema carpocapsae]